MNSKRGILESEDELLSRRIVVTGATGMVGGRLVAELLRAGYSDITLAVRNKARIRNTYETLGKLGVTVPEGVLKVVETDLTDPALLARNIGTADTVFNCAARIMSGSMTAEELIRNNVSIARSVVDWCIVCGIRKLLHISSIAALGDAPGPGEPVTEDCLPDGVEGYAAYGRSKYYSELEVWRGAEAGLEVVAVSPGVILGESEARDNNSAALIPAISCGQPFYTEGLMSYVDVSDVARAMVILDRTPEAVGQRFILSAGDMTYKELITLGARAAGRPRPFIRIGRGAVDFAYGAMQAGIKLRLFRDKGVTRENLGSVLRTTRYDGSKITRMCGFQYTPLPETVKRVVENYRRKRRSDGKS